MSKEITENVMPPRALFVRFPYGAPLGPAGDAETRRAVVREALSVLVSASQPGAIVTSAIPWPD